MDIQQFIKQQGFNLTYESFNHAVDAFCAEMQKGLQGRESSLKMIPAYIEANSETIKDEWAIAVDMGGTNLRVVLVHFDESGSPACEEAHHYPMPGREGVIEKDAFFNIIAGYIAPFTKHTGKIGLCFSFPCEIQPNLDGTIMYFNKEVQINGCEGASLKENLVSALKRQGVNKDISLTVINDTVATALGACANTKERPFSTYIGFILGTGTNTCYAESNMAVSKNAHLSSRKGRSLVNLESGGYAGFARTEVDMLYDAGTAAPGTQQFEKLVSGAYQGMLFQTYLQQAAKAGCFSSEAAHRLMEMPPLSSYHIDMYMDNPFGDTPLAVALVSPRDKQAAWTLADAFFDRAAFTTAVNLAAVLKQSGSAMNPLQPACISAEGSTFRKCKPLNRKTQYYLYAYGHKQMGLQYEFLYEENTTIFGSAYAALHGLQ